MKLSTNVILTSLVAGITSASALAQGNDNLIANAITANADLLDNKAAFYDVWRLSDSNGDRVGESQLPYSCFAELLPGNRYQYNGSVYSTYNDVSSDIADNDYFLLLKYPNSPLDYNYNLPIKIDAEGDYVLSGTIAIAENNSSISTETVVNLAPALVVTADEYPSKKNIEVVTNDGLFSIGVTNAADGSVPVYGQKLLYPIVNAYSKSIQFEFNLHLTPELKYLSFYMPSHLMAIANLKLVCTNSTDVSSVQMTDPDLSKSVYYDLQGRKQSNTDSLLPGLYIRKTGSKTEKLYIK